MWEQTPEEMGSEGVQMETLVVENNYGLIGLGRIDLEQITQSLWAVVYSSTT